MWASLDSLCIESSGASEARYNPAIALGVGASKARQAHALKAVLDEALDAWGRSKQPARRARKETRQPGSSRTGSSRGASGRIELTRTEVQSRVGGPRFLTEAREALANLRKLYGLNADA